MSQLARDQSPLWGVVLCCTSIPPEQRSQLAAVALQMGATHKLDLTSDVTHLIVGNIDTQKYKYVAKERQDIKVLKPEWLDAVRASWIQGGDTDVLALEHQYRLPPLYELHICVTGFDDLAQRTQIQDVVASSGATYHGDLTKSSVTHLIAAHPTGRKYEYAGLWRIKIVSIEWLHQSLHRGMALEESLFNPLMPAEERGKGAVTAAKPASPTTLRKRARPSDLPPDPAEAGRRKLRRSASTRLGSQSGDLWADIGGAGAGDGTGAGHGAAVAPNPPPQPRPLTPQSQDSSIHHQPAAPGVLKAHKDKPLFADMSLQPSIFVYGFDETRMNVLSTLLSSEGARLVSDKELENRSPESTVTVLVPHAPDVAASPHSHGLAAFEHLLSTGLALHSDQVVTEFWIEQCLFHHRLISATDAPLCQPFKSFPIPGFDKLTVCPTSFSGCDLLHFSKAAKLMGAIYNEYLTKDTTVLVCRDTSANPGKLRYALENSIPVVSAQWFYDCVRSGTLLDFDDYQLSTSRQSQKQSQPCFYHPITNPRQHSASERPSKSSMGRLDLAPSLPSDISQPSRVRKQHSMVADESFETANESAGVLKDVSLSKQNSQQRRREMSASSASVAPSGNKSLQKTSLSVARPRLLAVGVESLDSLHDEESLGEVSFDAVTEQQQVPTSASTKPHDQGKTLNNALAAVLARRKPSPAPSQKNASTTSLSKSHRTLGRAASTGSHAMSRATSLDSRQGSTAQAQPALASEAATAAETSLFDPELEATGKTRLGPRRHDAPDDAMFRPSQALSYEHPDALALKEQLMKRVHGAAGRAASALDETGDGGPRGERVQSIGVVKNSAGIDDRRRRGMRKK